MKNNIRFICLLWLATYILYASTEVAKVYADGYWKAIGLGNMPCDEFLSKSEDAGYKELGAV